MLSRSDFRPSRASKSRSRYLRGGPTSTRRLIWSRRSCASLGSIAFLHAVRPRRGAAPTGAHAYADPQAQSQARAGGAQYGRGCDLVVPRQKPGGFVRRRRAQLALANPIAADLSDMRPSLIPGLVSAAQKNADRGFPDVALFEVGQVFRGDAPQDQFTAAAGVRRALGKPSGIGRHWTKRDGEVDAFDAKADALAVLAAAGAPARRCRSFRAVRPGSIPAARGRSRSARKTCSGISANCIRARSRRSTPKVRSSPSR